MLVTMDQWLIYDKELSSGEVTALWGGGNGIATPSSTNLVCWYNFEQATTDTLENQISQTKIAENTLFEETDTYKTYWLQSGAWTRNYLPVELITRGVACLGDQDGNSEVYDYVTIGTLGNATDFGNCTSPARFDPAACADATRGVVFGGGISASQNIIEFIMK